MNYKEKIDWLFKQVKCLLAEQNNNGGTPGIIEHNNTINKQGGILNEYYHLTQNEHTDLLELLSNPNIGNQNLESVTTEGNITSNLLKYDSDLSGIYDNRTLVDKAYIDNLNIPTLVTSSTNLSTDLLWNNKIIHINNGSSNINLVVNDLITTAFTKLGTGTITITAGSGKTLFLSDNTNVCNGIKGSTFLITPDLTVLNQSLVMITNR